MAVTEDNYMVATFAFARTKQDRGESYRSFASRHRGVAEVCEFHEPCGNCGHIVDHSESRVSDQLCIGMADPDIQEELMGEASKRLTVEQTLKFIEKKATGKRSANAIKATTPTTNALDDEADQEDAVRSTYKRQGQGQQRPQGRHTPVKPNKPQQTPMKPVDQGKPNMHPEGPARHVQLLRPIRAWHRIKDSHQEATMPRLRQDMSIVWPTEPLLSTMLANH